MDQLLFHATRIVKEQTSLQVDFPVPCMALVPTNGQRLTQCFGRVYGGQQQLGVLGCDNGPPM